MAKFEYESPFHLYNSMKKVLWRRGFLVEKEHHKEGIGILCDIFFYFLKNEDNATTKLKLGLREPIKVLTWITNQEKFNDLDQYIEMIEDTVNGYEMIFANKKMIEGYEHLFIQRSNFDPTYEELSSINNKEVSKKFIEGMSKLKFSAGVYFLYNSSKKLIYIGKSQDLGGRIPGSVRERKASYYSYALTNSYSDAGIYEMYYIATMKPKLNVDGNFPDQPTVKLPDLEIMNLTKIFTRKRGGVSATT